MEILLMLVFVSMVFLAGALLAFAYSVKNGEADHADRLSQMPLCSPDGDPFNDPLNDMKEKP
jgi:cbb3-type cytochrome oxidase maturation protein